MITAQEAKNRKEAAQAVVDKKKATLTKRQAKLEQMKAAYSAGIADEYEARCAKIDIEGAEEDIRRLVYAIKEKEKAVQTWANAEAKAVSCESRYDAIPEALKDFEASLVRSWNAWDTHRKSVLANDFEQMGYIAFMKKHTYSDYEFIRMSNEEMKAKNADAARSVTLDLYQRVKDITGDVVSWNGLRATYGNENFIVVNGIVIGQNGTANVKSITAGGYNIQRLHIRTLVHALA